MTDGYMKDPPSPAPNEFEKLLVELTKDPRTRLNVSRAIKELRPDIEMPYLEIDEFKESVNKKLEEEKAEREREKVIERLERERERIVKKYGEEATKEIEALMEKNGLADYSLAAKLYAADLPPPKERSAPVNRHGERWEMPNFEEFKTNARDAALKKAYEVIDEMRGGRR